MNSNREIAHEEISQRARIIWEQAGRPDGQETEHWLRAERELRNERRAAQSAANAPAGRRPSQSKVSPR